MDNFQQACYPYISNGFGWTSNDKKIKSGKLKIKVKTAYLPDGEEDKTCLHVGVMEDSKEIISVYIWVSKQNLYIQCKGSLVFLANIDTGTEMMEVEFDIDVPFSGVIINNVGASYHIGKESI